MSNYKEPQRVAIPALLRQGLVAFREVQGNEQRYKVRDDWKGLTYQFEPWQFFVLEVLPACDEFSKLASVFNDRFGHSITNEEVQHLFSMVNDTKLFGLSAYSHPMVASFYKKKGIRLDRQTQETSSQLSDVKSNRSIGESLPKQEDTFSSAGNTESRSKTESASTANSKKKPLPMAIPDAAILNTADFTLNEFKAQNKDYKILNQKIRNEGYQLDTIKAPENSIDWLNSLLEIPDLYEKISVQKPNFILTDEIKRLKEQTEKNRKGVFKYLKVEEQNAIRRLNRLLIELIYPQETPKALVLGAVVAAEKGWKLFDPTRLIKLIFPFLRPFKYVVYLLPALLIVALFTVLRNTHIINEDFDRFLLGVKYSHYNYALHLFIGMFTDNLLVTLVSALVAHSYRATVNSFYVQLHLGFYPRFHVCIGHKQQLSRRESIWLYAAPILARFGLISICVLLWFGTRNKGGPLAHLSMTIGSIVMVSLFLVTNPLIKSSGYHLLAAVLNEPQMRAKAALAIANKLRGNVYQKLDNDILVAYALASSLFMITTFAIFIWLFGNYLKFHLGGAGIFLVVLVILLLILRLTKKTKQIGDVFERSIQYERWKNRAIPKVESVVAETESKSTPLSYVKISIISLIVLGLIVPYNYEPGGHFVVLPIQMEEIASENAGIIEKVYFTGGELLEKGAVIAKLSSIDYQFQLNILTEKVQEQQAVVNDLKSRPKPEEVELAECELEKQEAQYVFSKEKLDRYKQLYEQKTISFEELEDQRKKCEIDFAEVKENRAKLELIKAGVTPDQIAAAEAKLQSYKTECDYYKEKIAQSFIRMPFNGRLIGINLKQKIGHYLNKGEVFATAENTNQVFTQIEVPEPDIRYVMESARIRARLYIYYNEEINGVVTSIDPIVTVTKAGNVVKVFTLVDNKDGQLHTGMTGHAKISTKAMPVWEVLSLAIIRFFKVEVWSWIP
ncbi:MAG: efflux RND transporter periplasmic adaptor subunit [Candidatus Brocadia sp.]|nr:efflux RND transporter periplasmic adaptor subunit [Candidatus Brocadia sp.]